MEQTTVEQMIGGLAAELIDQVREKLERIDSGEDHVVDAAMVIVHLESSNGTSVAFLACEPDHELVKRGLVATAQALCIPQAVDEDE